MSNMCDPCYKVMHRAHLYMITIMSVTEFADKIYTSTLKVTHQCCVKILFLLPPSGQKIKKVLSTDEVISIRLKFTGKYGIFYFSSYKM